MCINLFNYTFCLYVIYAILLCGCGSVGDDMSFGSGQIWASADSKYSEYMTYEYYTGVSIDEYRKKTDTEWIEDAINKILSGVVVRDMGDGTEKLYHAIAVTVKSDTGYKRDFVVGVIVTSVQFDECRKGVSKVVASLEFDSSPVRIEFIGPHDYNVVKNWEIIQRHVELRIRNGESLKIRGEKRCQDDL